MLQPAFFLSSSPLMQGKATRRTKARASKYNTVTPKSRRRTKRNVHASHHQAETPRKRAGTETGVKQATVKRFPMRPRLKETPQGNIKKKKKHRSCVAQQSSILSLTNSPGRHSKSSKRIPVRPKGVPLIRIIVKSPPCISPKALLPARLLIPPQPITAGRRRTNGIIVFLQLLAAVHESRHPHCSQWQRVPRRSRIARTASRW